MAIIHLLGANIPHHNATLLDFFNHRLHVEVPNAVPRKFMVVSENKQLNELYPHLVIECYATKGLLAKAVIEQAKNRQIVFFCHGQFNAFLWLALLNGKIRRHQLHWHIWGADLYEESKSLSFRLFYLLRRFAQGRVASVSATLGDISVYQQRYPNIPCYPLYFPTKMPSAPVVAKQRDPNQPLTILLGNSGDVSNRHCQALTQISEQFGQQVAIIIPMGYPENNSDYIQQVTDHAASLFYAQQVKVLTTKLDFTHYLQLLAECDLGYFIFTRQQGVGTLSLLIEQNIPFVISRKNPFWQDLAAQQLPILFDQDLLTAELIEQAHQQLLRCDKSHLAFFSPGYLQGWRELLHRLEGAEA